MVNKERVFHIDQECFIIFAEDLSSKKERFLRIGNTMDLKQYGEGLTFVSLITPLFPGDAFKEPEIFSPQVDKRIIGLQNVTDRFVKFLRLEGVNTNRVMVSRADGKGHPAGKKITEDQFIDKIKGKPISGKHSFASFYDDGNIRIFNKNELMFDLNDSLAKTVDEPKEIDLLTNHYKKYFGPSYQNDGMIYSGKSLFIFSQNEFACITESSNWVRDAVIVGINPMNVSFLYILPEARPDSLWLKSFLQRKNDIQEKIRLVIMGEEPNWLNLVSEEVFLPVYPQKESVEVFIGGVRLFFQNHRINIYYNDMRLQLRGQSGFLQEGATIDCQYLFQNKKSVTKICLNTFDENAVELYKNTPMLFVNKHSDDSQIYDGRNLDKSNKHLLLKQNLGVDSSGKMVARVEVVTKKCVNIDEDVNPFCFFLQDYTLDEVKQKYETFYNRLGKQYNLEKDDIIAINDRYEKIIRDKQFYLDEQKRLFDFIEVLDTQAKLSEKDSDNELPKENKTIKDEQKQKENKPIQNEPKKQEPPKQEEKSVGKDSILDENDVNENEEEKIDFGNNKNAEDEDGIEFKDEGKAKHNTLEDDTFNAQELLQGAGFDEYADQIKSMRVGRKYEFRDTKEQRAWLAGGEDEEKPKKSGKLWWILLLLLLLLLLFGLGFWFLPKYLNKDQSQQKVLKQLQYKYNEPENQQQDEIIQDENSIIGLINDSNMPIKSVKTSFYYKFRMTVQDQIQLTNEIAVANKYAKMGEKEASKYDPKDPHWIYPGNIITMPDGSNIEVKGGDNMWSLCEDFLIAEINGYELEVRNLIESTKGKMMNIEDAKKRFAEIKEETHSQMVRDFMDALLVQSNYEGWESQLVINETK